MGPTPTPLPSSDVQQQLQTNRAQRVRALTPVYDAAAMFEAAIVTIAGVAWFLIRAKETSAQSRVSASLAPGRGGLRTLWFPRRQAFGIGAASEERLASARVNAEHHRGAATIADLQ